MKKWFLFLILIFCIEAHAQSLQLVLNWKPEPQFGGFYAAHINNLFKKKSLPVNIIPGGAGTPTIQIVAAGQAEFGIVSAEELVISRARGTDVVALFAVYQANPVCIMTHADQGFKSLKEVFQSQTTIAVQKGLPFYLYLEKKLGKPKGRVVPSLGGVTNFLSDSHYAQQCFVTSEPLLAERKGVKVKSFLTAEEGFNPYLTVLVARKSYVDQNKEKVQAFVEAVREGWKAYLDNPEQTNHFMHQLNPSMDEGTFKESAHAQKPLIETNDTQKNGLGFMSLERWQSLCDQSQQIGLTQKKLNASELFINFKP